MWLDAQGSPKWALLLATLPEAIETPVLWPAEERAALLRGSPVRSASELRPALCPGSVPRHVGIRAQACYVAAPCASRAAHDASRKVESTVHKSEPGSKGCRYVKAARLVPVCRCLPGIILLGKKKPPHQIKNNSNHPMCSGSGGRAGPARGRGARRGGRRGVGGAGAAAGGRPRPLPAGRVQPRALRRGAGGRDRARRLSAGGGLLRAGAGALGRAAHGRRGGRGAGLRPRARGRHADRRAAVPARPTNLAASLVRALSKIGPWRARLWSDAGCPVLVLRLLAVRRAEDEAGAELARHVRARGLVASADAQPAAALHARFQSFSCWEGCEWTMLPVKLHLTVCVCVEVLGVWRTHAAPGALAAGAARRWPSRTAARTGSCCSQQARWRTTTRLTASACRRGRSPGSAAGPLAVKLAPAVAVSASKREES